MSIFLRLRIGFCEYSCAGLLFLHFTPFEFSFKCKQPLVSIAKYISQDSKYMPPPLAPPYPHTHIHARFIHAHARRLSGLCKLLSSCFSLVHVQTSGKYCLFPYYGSSGTPQSPVDRQHTFEKASILL